MGIQGRTPTHMGRTGTYTWDLHMGRTGAYRHPTGTGTLQGEIRDTPLTGYRYRHLLGGTLGDTLGGTVRILTFPRGGYPYIKVGVGGTLAGTHTTIIMGVQVVSMKGDNTTLTFENRPCPDCGEDTGMVHLGGEPPREVCGRFGCNWDGRVIA